MSEESETPPLAESVARARVTARAATYWTGAVLVSLGFAYWPSLSVQSQALALAVGGGVVAVGLTRGLAPRAAQVTARQAAPWGAAFLALCGWEVLAFLGGNNDAWPTLSMLTGPLDDTNPAGRFLAGLVWLRVGTWLLSRVGP